MARPRSLLADSLQSALSTGYLDDELSCGRKFFRKNFFATAAALAGIAYLFPPKNFYYGYKRKVQGLGNFRHESSLWAPTAPPRLNSRPRSAELDMSPA